MESEGAERVAVVAAARSWLGTPYHHAADVKGRKGGVDCAMLLVRVYCDLGLVEPFDPALTLAIGSCTAMRSAISASYSHARARCASQGSAM